MKKDQTHGVPSRVIMPIPSPRMVYTTPIMITQANRFLGWSPPIPINLKGERTRSMVNFGT
jgi:hypothetical protein